MYDELQWRLAAIDTVLDDLPMHAARWPSLSEDRRREIRLRWGAALRHVDHIQRNKRRYLNGHESPDWFVMLELRLEEAEPLLEFMELRSPY